MPTLVSRRTFSDRFTTVPVGIDSQTDVLEVHISRPTAGAPRAWDATSRIRVHIVVTLDGVEYRCSGGTTGGVRTSRGGVDVPEYILAYEMPWGVFGMPEATKRLGERGRSYTAHIDVELLTGRIRTEIEVWSTESPAPASLFHNSVAFDVASSALETGGDGVISVSHTASGTNRAMFAHNTSTFSTVIDTTGITYAGNAGVEMWDISDAGQVTTAAGYRLAGDANIPTGSQTVTATLASAPDNQVIGVMTMTGVDPTTPVGTPVTQVFTTPSGSPVSVTVGSVGADDLVVDGTIVVGPTAPTVGADQTQRYAQDNLSGIFTRGSSQLGSAGGLMSWTLDSSSAALLGAVAFKPAVGGAVHRLLKLGVR